MMGIKLNARVMIKNIQNMHEQSLPPTGARRRMERPGEHRDWARLQLEGRGPQADATTAWWDGGGCGRVQGRAVILQWTQLTLIDSGY